MSGFYYNQLLFDQSFWFRLINVRTSKPSKSYRMNSYFANEIPSSCIEIFYQNNNCTNSVSPGSKLPTIPFLFTSFCRIKDKISKTSIHIKDSTRRANQTLKGENKRTILTPILCAVALSSILIIRDTNAKNSPTTLANTSVDKYNESEAIVLGNPFYIEHYQDVVR